MNTRQLLLIATVLIGSIAMGTYEISRASSLRAENRNLFQRQEPLAVRLRELERERDRTSGRLSDMAGEFEKNKGLAAELLKLRAEAAFLRNTSNALSRLNATVGNVAGNPAEGQMTNWLGQLKQLKQRLLEDPKLAIPELQLLTEQDWLKAAYQYTKRPQYDAETDFRMASADARKAAEGAFATMALEALTRYTQSNKNGFPADLSQLKSYFGAPVDDTILQRWTVAPGDMHPGTANNPQWVLTQKSLADEDYDHRITISPGSFSVGQALAEQMPPDVLAIKHTLDPLLKDFGIANGGQMPNDVSQLTPYAKTPEQQTAIQKAMEIRKAAKQSGSP